eukprot:g1362.t1
MVTVFLVGFHYARHRWGVFGASGNVIQTEKPHLDFSQELVAHATRWEGIALLLPYLCLTWMLRMMPQSYYDLTNESACVSFFGLFDPTHVFLQLISVDFFMYLAHITEHRLGWLYRKGHKKHHKWTNPRLFDAYSGHIYDTTLMILVPLYATANVVPSNCGGYICFGTTYSAYLMLIHSEYALPWDAWSRALGIGTAHDHNVHHTKIVYNFGHFFMLWDQLFGTYMDPTTVKKFRVYEKTNTSDVGDILWKLDKVFVSSTRGVLKDSDIVKDGFANRSEDGSFQIDIDVPISRIMDPSGILNMLARHSSRKSTSARERRSSPRRERTRRAEDGVRSKKAPQHSIRTITEESANRWITDFRRRLIQLQLKKVSGATDKALEIELQDAKVAYYDFLERVGLKFDEGIAPRWSLDRDSLDSCAVARMLSSVRSALRIHARDVRAAKHLSSSPQNKMPPTNDARSSDANPDKALCKHLDMASVLVGGSRAGSSFEEKREDFGVASSKMSLRRDQDKMKEALRSWKEASASTKREAETPGSKSARSSDRRRISPTRSPTHLRYVLSGNDDESEMESKQRRNATSPLFPRRSPRKRMSPRRFDWESSPARGASRSRPGTAGTDPGADPPRLNMEDLGVEDRVMTSEDVYPDNLFIADDDDVRTDSADTRVRDESMPTKDDTFAAHLTKELRILDQFERRAIGDMARRKVRIGEIVEELAIAKEQLRVPSGAEGTGSDAFELPPLNDEEDDGDARRKKSRASDLESSQLKPLPRRCVTDAFQSLPHERSRRHSSSSSDAKPFHVMRATSRSDTRKLRERTVRGSREKKKRVRNVNIPKRAQDEGSRGDDGIGIDSLREENEKPLSLQTNKSSANRSMTDLERALLKNVDRIEADFHLLDAPRVHFRDLEETINVHVPLTADSLRELFDMANVYADGTVDLWQFVAKVRGCVDVGIVKVRSQEEPHRRSREASSSGIPRPKINVRRSKETKEDSDTLSHRAAFGEASAGQELARRRIRERRRKEKRRKKLEAEQNRSADVRRNEKSASNERSEDLKRSLTPHTRAKQRALRVLREKRVLAEEKKREERARKERLQILEFETKQAREASLAAVLSNEAAASRRHLDRVAETVSSSANESQPSREALEAQRRARRRAQERAKAMQERLRQQKELAKEKWRNRFAARDRRLEAFKQKRQNRDEDAEEGERAPSETLKEANVEKTHDSSMSVGRLAPAARTHVSRHGSVTIESVADRSDRRTTPAHPAAAIARDETIATPKPRSMNVLELQRRAAWNRDALKDARALDFASGDDPPPSIEKTAPAKSTEDASPRRVRTYVSRRGSVDIDLPAAPDRRMYGSVGSSGLRMSLREKRRFVSSHSGW